MELLQHARFRLGDISPAPWYLNREENSVVCESTDEVVAVLEGEPTMADKHLIADAPELITALADEVERLRALILKGPDLSKLSVKARLRTVLGRVRRVRARSVCMTSTTPQFTAGLASLGGFRAD